MAENKNIFDTNYLGETDDNGILKVVYNKEALSNAIILWLTYFPGEIIYDADSNGILYYYLSQPMSFNTASNMRQAIISSLEEDFETSLKVLGCSVIPYLNKNKYLIKLKVYSFDFSDEVYLEFPLNSLT